MDVSVNTFFCKGIESFLEDTEINVDVNNGGDDAAEPEEVASEVAESTEDSAEVTEAEGDAQQVDNAAEMFFDHIDRMFAARDYVERYGVNSAFLALMDYNGALSSICGNMPSCESYSEVGSPSSYESQQVLAGLENVLSTVWDFIKRMYRAVIEIIKRVVSSITSFFTNHEKTVNRLREELRSYDSGTVPPPDAKLKSPTPSELDKYAKTINNAAKSIGKAKDENAVDTIVKSLESMKFSSDKEVVLQKTKAKDIVSSLDMVIEIIHACNQHSADYKTKQAQAERGVKDAESALAANEKKSSQDKVNEAKRQAKLVSAQTKGMVKCDQTAMRLVTAYIKFASAWIRACKGSQSKRTWYGRVKNPKSE